MTASQTLSSSSAISPRRSRSMTVVALCTVVTGMVLGPSVSAQTYRLRDGRVLSAEQVTVRGNRLIQAVDRGKPGQAEIGFPVASVVAMEWPEPPELSLGRAAFAALRFEEARSAADSVAGQFSVFADVPGSWWGDAELLRLRSLVALQRAAEAKGPAEVLAQRSVGGAVAVSARLLLVEFALGEKRFGEAKAALAEILKSPQPASIEAQAAVLLGDLYAAELAWESALEAYLQIPAFHSTRRDLLSKALLGSARAYRGLGDRGRVERTLLELSDDFPNSTEAKQAEREFKP